MHLTPDESTVPVIEAAGGVIEKQTGDGLLIAIVRRDRYGLEWALPKGKRQLGESWQDTARREVCEETGLKASPLAIVGCTSYLAGSAPKMVVYWRMRLQQEPDEFTPNQEAKELRWLSPAEAIELLTHEEEKQILRTLFPVSPGTQTRLRPWRRIVLWCRRMFRAKPLQRLLTSIQAYKLELEGRAGQSPPLSSNLPALQAGLATAARAANDGQLEGGWKSLLTVQRVELLFLGEKDLQAAALAIRHEATKLNPWRKAAVLELLASGRGAPVTTERVFKAAALRDEHYHNEAYKDSLRRSNALLLASFLVLIIGALLLKAKNGEFQTLEATWSDKAFGVGFISLVGLVGLLGANVSAITDIAQDHVSARIPEMVSTFRVTILRHFIGAASAIFLFFVARAGVILQVADAYAMLVFAFASGFSERLVLRVVRSIVDKGDQRG